MRIDGAILDLPRFLSEIHQILAYKYVSLPSYHNTIQEKGSVFENSHCVLQVTGDKDTYECVSCNISNTRKQCSVGFEWPINGLKKFRCANLGKNKYLHEILYKNKIFQPEI